MGKAIKTEDFLFFVTEYAKLKGIHKDKYNSDVWQQKMIFFIHWNYLHEKNELFFSDTFEAWPLGPVSFLLYKKQKEKIKLPLSNDKIKKEIDLDKEFNELFSLENKEKWEYFKICFEKYSKFSTWELVQKSHKLESWQKNFDCSMENIVYGKNIISNDSMKNDKYK